MNKTNQINPLKNILMTIGTLPTSYLISMTYEEQLLYLLNYLKNEVIPKTNANIQAVNQLIDFIENYFNNLDVQEEINNKLNEMIEDGTLEELLDETFNNFIKKYDTITDMLNDENIVDNIFVKTYGYSTKFDNAGVNNFYISSNLIENTIYFELHNDLYAILLDKEINLATLNLTNLDDISSYNLTKIKKITFDKNYILTNSITFNNIEIDVNNKIIQLDLENHNNIILNNNCVIKNGVIKSNDYSSLTISNGKCIKVEGNNNVIDNIEFNGYYSIYSNNDIDNLEIKNCLLNSYRCEICLEIGKFTNINIHDNKQTRIHNYTTPVQHHNVIQLYNKVTWNNNTLVSNEITQDILSNYYGENININNNEFNSINARSVYVINCHNVNIKNNKTYNPFGDKVNHSLVGYSDDVYVIDLCKYCEISNNLVENSGENGIDILSSKYVNVTNNKLIGIDSDGICIFVSDCVSEGIINNDVNNDLLISEFINVNGNSIDTMSLGIKVGTRNSSFNNNTLKLHANNKDHVGFNFVSYTALNTVGNYGDINCVGNSVDINMNLGFSNGGNTIFTNINSNIILDENSGLKMTKEIDNSSLANDSDTKLYVISHNVYFKNFKLYLINSNDNNRLIELPLTSSSNNGILNYDNGKFNFYFNTYKHFTNISYSNQSANYYNLTQGTVKIIFY